ncbi:MAG: hypothetical protein HY814_02355 [Candidatus Riflebacteria bacterium]|nr:hypothetical protein [Candidatus Riflebacteria bacterium]
MVCATASWLGFVWVVGTVGILMREWEIPAAAFMGQLDRPDALEFFASRPRHGEQGAAIGYLEAFGWLRSGQAGKAVTGFQSLVAPEGPFRSDGEAWFNLGTALARAGKLEEARNSWRRARELGQPWADYNLDGLLPAGVTTDDAIGQIAAHARKGELAIPPGRERVVTAVRGELARSPWGGLRHFWRCLDSSLRGSHSSDLLLAWVLFCLWVCGVSVPGLLGRRAPAAETTAIASEQRPSRSGLEGLEPAWDDEEFLERPREPLVRFVARHLLALALPGFKPFLRGAALAGAAMVAAAVLGAIAGLGLEKASSSWGPAGIGPFSAMITPHLFETMFGGGYSVTWEPFGWWYVSIVGWLLPAAFAANAAWLLGQWRRGR